MADLGDRTQDPISTGRSWARIAGKILLGALALLVVLCVVLVAGKLVVVLNVVVVTVVDVVPEHPAASICVTACGPASSP